MPEKGTPAFPAELDISATQPEPLKNKRFATNVRFKCETTCEAYEAEPLESDLQRRIHSTQRGPRPPMRK